VANVGGVRGITNTIVVSPTQNSKARSVARDLESRIAKAYPHLDVGISVVDDIALLVGRVDLLSTKRRIESVAESHNSINRIINKIEVSKPHKERRQ
jgi:osmotically-inducible protein OsmY